MPFKICRVNGDGTGGPQIDFFSSHDHMHSAANWMAPELMIPELPSVESDLYSFCAVMWEILTGIKFTNIHNMYMHLPP